MALVVAAASISCGKKRAVDPLVSADAPYVPPGAGSWTVPSEDEAAAYAATLTAAFEEGSMESLYRHMDWDAIAERAVAGVPGVSEPDRTAFAAEVVDVAQTDLARVMSAVSEGAARFLRTRLSNNERAVLLRVTTKDGGVSYLEFYVAKQDDGLVRSVDFHDYGHGDLASLEARRVFAFAQSKVRDENRVANMWRKLHQEDYRGVQTEFSELAEKTQNSAFALEILSFAAMERSEEQFKEAIAELVSKHPDHPAALVRQLDLRVLEGDHDKALEAIDALDKKVGGDPFLDVLRASIYHEKKEPEKARLSALSATKREPALFDGWSTLFALSVEQGRFEEASDQLLVLAREFAVEPDALEGEQFAAFRASKAFRSVAKRLRGNTAVSTETP